MIRCCTVVLVLAGALATMTPAGAAPRHGVAAPPKAVLTGRCGAGAHRVQTAYVAGDGPTCCRDELGCAEFLSTTTIVRTKAPIRS